MASAVGSGLGGMFGLATGAMAHTAAVGIPNNEGQHDRFDFLADDQNGNRATVSAEERADGEGESQSKQDPAHGLSESKMRSFLPYLPQWAFWPDYERASNINRIIAQLWPPSTVAAMKMAREQLPELVKDVLRKVPFLRSAVLQQLDLGAEPIKIGGLKSYETNQDEVIIELALVWPSDLQVTLSLLFGIGPFELCLPVQLRYLQLHGTVRTTLKPLLDQLPCIGSAAVSLLGNPYIDFQLRIGEGPDLMSVPGLKHLADIAMGAVIRRLAVYPNQVWLDIVPHGGVPTPPAGMLVVKVVKCTGLVSDDIISKADAYCLVEIREGRGLRTKTVYNSNNPVFNEEFQLVVDDPCVQTLGITVRDDDFGWGDSTLGVAELPLKDAAFVQFPNTKFPLILDLFKPPQETPGGLMALPLDIIGLPGRFVKEGGKLVRFAGTGGQRPPLANTHHQQPDTRTAQQPTRPPGPSQVANSTGTSERYSQGADSGPGQRGRLHPIEADGSSSSSGDSDRGSGGGLSGYCSDDESASGSGGSNNGTCSSSADVTTPAQPRPKTPLVPDEKRPAGKVFLEVSFLPFDTPTEPLEEVVDVLGVLVRRRRQTELSGTDESIQEDEKGVLTVNVIRASNLGGWESEPDPYVVIKVVDKEQNRIEKQRTATMFNEVSPRWCQKFDFAMISAGSMLHLSVHDKTTAWESLTSINPNLKARFKHKVIGKLHFNVLDIARAGRIRDAWPMTDVQQGDLELELSWLCARFRSDLAPTNTL